MEANVGDIRASLVVDLSQWTRGLQTAASQLQTFQAGLSGRLNPTLSATSQAMTTVGTQAQAMGTQMQNAARATSGLSAAMQIAAGVGLATSVQGMVTALVSFSRETIQVGARLEQLRASLSALSGSVASGQTQFDSLFQTAQRLGVPFEALTRGWRGLTAAATQAGLPLADQRRLLEAVAAEGRRVGASNEELTRAFQALGQMASKGTVSLEELRGQLGEALPRALSAMALGMGRTTEELLKLVEAGGVTFPSAARALSRGLEELGRQGGQTGDTLASAFTRFSNELVRTQDELTKTVGPLMQVTRLAAGALKAVNDFAQAQRLLASTREEESRIGTGLRAADIARLPQAQRERVQALPGLIAEQEEAQNDPSFLARFGPNRAGRIAQLKAEQAELHASAQALKVKAAAEDQTTAAVNRAKDAAQLQADTIKDVTRQLDLLTKSQAEFRQKAALAPETFGRPGSAEFLRGQQAALRPQVEKLTESLTRLPAGVTLPAELTARAREADVQVGRIGSQIDALQTRQSAGRKAESEAEQARKQAAREAAQAQEQYQSAIDRVRMSLISQQETAVATLTRLEESYTQTAAGQDRLTAAKLAAQFPENEEIQRRAALVTGLSEEAEATRESFNAIQQRTNAVREAAEAEQAFQNKLDAATLKLRAAPEEREEVKLRAEAQAQGVAISPEQEAQLQGLTQLRLEQQRLTMATQIWRDVAFGVGSAWSQALQSIAEHTKTVGQAFEAMGKQILQTFADIAAQQATQALFGLGLGLLTSALTGGVSVGAGGGGVSAASAAGMGGEGALFGATLGVPMMQHGGVVNQPTLIMAGERGPEHIVPQAQMQSLMSGQGGQRPPINLSVINVTSKAEADQAKAQAEARGHEAIIVNAVLKNLSTGEASSINRAMRSLQR